MLEAAPDQALDRVLELAAVEHVGHQHRAVVGRERDAVARQQVRRGLDVVADLEDPGILEQRPQPLDRRLQRQTLAGSPAERRRSSARRAMAERDIGGEPGRQRQRDPAQGRASAGDAARLRPDRDRARLLRRLDPVVEALDRVDERIGARRGEGRDLRDHRLASARSSDRRA